MSRKDNRTEGLIATLREWAHGRRYRVAWGPAEIVVQAQQEICDRHGSR